MALTSQRSNEKRRSLVPTSLTFMLLAVLCGCQRSSEYPSRPITLVCPWAVGGGTDRVSRQVAMYLKKELGTPVNVVNATGGQGVTGHARGIRARPDGYTISMMTLELNMLHWRNLTDLTWKDSAPLMSLNEDPAALFVKSDSEIQTVTDLEKAVRDRPGELKASGTAALAAWHLALAGWLISIDQNPTDVIWMPSQGSAPSLQELMTGDLDLVCCSLPEARSLLASGDIRCIGVMAEKRQASEEFSSYPTLNEQGSDWTLTGWRGLGVPRETPPEIQQRLVTALEKIVSGESRVNGESFPEFMDKQGFDRTARPTDEFAEFLKRNDEMFGAILTRPEFQSVQSGPVGPMAFPAVAAGLLCLSLISILISSARRAKTQKMESDGEGSLDPSSTPALLLSGCVVVAVVFHILAAETLGFVLTAAVILFVTSKVLGARVRTSAVLAAVASIGLYQLFSGLLQVPLPLAVF